jgi:hypothetical protein
MVPDTPNALHERLLLILNEAANYAAPHERSDDLNAALAEGLIAGISGLIQDAVDAGSTQPEYDISDTLLAVWVHRHGLPSRSAINRQWDVIENSAVYGFGPFPSVPARIGATA